MRANTVCRAGPRGAKERTDGPRLEALLYESAHRGHAGDADFYRERCAGSRSVLELGCGTGRVLRGLARQVELAVGLDRHAGALALARSRAPELCWVAGDMRAFAFRRRFDRVLMPYSTLFCLLDDTQVSRCLEQVRAQLASDGRFLLDAYQVTPRDELDTNGTPRAVAEVDLDGASIEIAEQRSWDRRARRADARYVHRHSGGELLLEYTIEQRYLYRWQLEALLERAGFEVRDAWGGFGGEPLDDDADQMVFECRAAGASRRSSKSMGDV